MMERPQVNIRLEKPLLDEIDELARSERVDRSEITRRLLNSGLASYRMDLALGGYRTGNLSAWKAADMAGVSLYEMLDRIHGEGIPYELDPEVLAQLDSRRPQEAAVRESKRDYGHGGSDAESGIADLRNQFRPERVNWLFVGESSPAGGTHFYRANSNLFRATRSAFAAAYGDGEVPDGPRFLHWFREHGCWLVDLAERPVNRLDGHERASVVAGGVDRLASEIGEAVPDHIVVVKASMASAVRTAATAAGFTGDVVELPFPVRQWTSIYVRDLTRALREDPITKFPGPRDDSHPRSAGVVDVGMTLDAAIEQVLRDNHNRPMSARAIADEISVRRTFLRPSDGLPPTPSQISARVSNKTYRDRFDRTPDGIRLRS